MEEHAHDPSLYERLRLLERLVRRQSVQLEADRERIAELTRQRAQEIVWEAGVPPPRPLPTPPPPRRKRTPKHQRHLHVVPGFVAAGLGWVWATRLRRVVTVGVSTAALTTGAVTPSVIAPGPPAHAGQGPVSVRHRHEETARPSPQPSDKRRKPHGSRSERHSPGGQPASAGGPQGGGGGAPSPAPSPVVSPLPTVPTPTPIPTPPLPTPQVCLPPPLCDQLNQCCDDDNTQNPVTQTREWLMRHHRLKFDLAA